MRISELSADTGVPVATIKYYLREGLLPAGLAVAATRAEYDDRHVARLRLVRALVEVGGLPLAGVRGVLDALDERSLPAAIGAAHEAISPSTAPGGTAPDAAADRATGLLGALGWAWSPTSPVLHRLDDALAALEAAGLDTDPRTLAGYADAALTLARGEIAAIPAADADAEEAVRYVVLGTVLYEPLLLTLRRLAQAHAYAESLATSG
jgi:DNA-binding transcriptional MerR regulator